MNTPPPLPATTAFVTVLGRVSIVLAVLGLLWALVQVLFVLMLPAELIVQMEAQPGLPALLGLCERSLGLVQASEPEQAMLGFARAVAQAMEQRAQAHPADDEPAYHNRLHTADVMLTVTTLLHAQGAAGQPAARPWAAVTLAAAVAHDFAHPGGANQQPFELERRSWQALAEPAAAVPAPWRERIESLVLHTDPAVVPANHQQVEGLAFSWTLPWCQVLLNEADILVSASADFGPALGQALAREWQRAGLAAHAGVATPAGRAMFLRSVRFSSPAAQALGMPQQVRQQLHGI